MDLMEKGRSYTRRKPTIWTGWSTQNSKHFSYTRAFYTEECKNIHNTLHTKAIEKWINCL